MNDSKQLMGRVLIVLGLLGGFTSVWYTLAFTWDPLFAAINLPDGPTHSNYHAFRGALLALAVNLLLLRVGFKGRLVSPEFWRVTLFMSVFYYLGWWAAWPIWGYHAPSIVAEMNHVIGSIGGLAGLYFLRPKQ